MNVKNHSVQKCTYKYMYTCVYVSGVIHIFYICCSVITILYNSDALHRQDQDDGIVEGVETGGTSMSHSMEEWRTYAGQTQMGRHGNPKISGDHEQPPPTFHQINPNHSFKSDVLLVIHSNSNIFIQFGMLTYFASELKKIPIYTKVKVGASGRPKSFASVSTYWKHRGETQDGETNVDIT